MVESTCIIPSQVHIVGLGKNDKGQYLVAYEIGEEETEFAYLDEFYEKISEANYYDALVKLVAYVFGDDEDE